MTNRSQDQISEEQEPSTLSSQEVSGLVWKLLQMRQTIADRDAEIRSLKQELESQKAWASRMISRM